MRLPQGYAQVFGPPGERLIGTRGDPGREALARDHECDTFQCNHCQKVVHVPPRCDPADLGGLCGNCGELICPRCVSSGQCTPWEKAMEEMEARQDALRSYGL